MSGSATEWCKSGRPEGETDAEKPLTKLLSLPLLIHLSNSDAGKGEFQE